jgi:hypothetical protein
MGEDKGILRPFWKGKEYSYRQWIGYTDPHEGSIGESESWNGP